MKKLDTSFESYFGVERSASNSDVVRIRVPYSRDDALRSKSMHREDTTNNDNNLLEENKIRISVQQSNEQSNGGAAKKYHRASLEESFNKAKLTSNKNHNNSKEIKSNSKSMTNL